jgi:hypothetical protein
VHFADEMAKRCKSMPQPFDSTIKDLLVASPEDWLDLLGLPHGGKIQLVDSDLSSISA